MRMMMMMMFTETKTADALLKCITSDFRTIRKGARKANKFWPKKKQNKLVCMYGARSCDDEHVCVCAYVFNCRASIIQATYSTHTT